MSKSPSDLIFEQIYSPAIQQGATERAAKDSAIAAVNDYKKSKYKSIAKLISDAITRAVKLS